MSDIPPKIAVVGRNGSGKTTLLKLIAGEYELTKLDNGEDSSLFKLSGIDIGYLKQITFDDESITLTGTLLFVSHDRYFIKQVAASVLVFENGSVTLYPYGYEYYLEQTAKKDAVQNAANPKEKKEKKEKRNYTTPAKEKARREARIRKLEECLSQCDEKIARIKAEIASDEVASDYIRLTELQKELEDQEELNLRYLEEWDMLMSAGQ